MERSEQRALTARIISDKLFRIETRMREIASTAAGDAHFREHMSAFFKQRHARARSGFGACDRSEKTGGAAPNNSDIQINGSRSIGLSFGIECRDGLLIDGQIDQDGPATHFAIGSERLLAAAGQIDHDRDGTGAIGTLERIFFLEFGHMLIISHLLKTTSDFSSFWGYIVFTTGRYELTKGR